MKTIAIAVQKGGAGKTATTRNLSAEIAAAGKRVLMIDTDPQGSLTHGTGIEAKEGETLASAIGGARPGEKTLQDIIRHIDTRLDLVPSGIDLSVAEIQIATRIGRENIIKKLLQPVAGSYDYCIIDTPPSLNLLTVNALAAADQVIVPIQPTADDIWSLQLFLDTLDGVKEINPTLQLFGVLLTFFDSRLTLHQQAVEELTEAGIPLLPERITRSIRIAEAAGEYKPLREYDPENKNNQAYKAIAERLIK